MYIALSESRWITAAVLASLGRVHFRLFFLFVFCVLLIYFSALLRQWPEATPGPLEALPLPSLLLPPCTIVAANATTRNRPLIKYTVYGAAISASVFGLRRSIK